jgi:hypothetical protein
MEEALLWFERSSSASGAPSSWRDAAHGGNSGMGFNLRIRSFTTVPDCTPREIRFPLDLSRDT